MIIALSIVATLLGVVFLLSPRVSQWLYSKLAFGPTRATKYRWKTAAGIKAEDVYFKTAWGRKLHGWFFANTGERASTVILYNHSNAGNVEEWLNIVSAMLETGASVFIYDYQGFGLSEGVPTIRGICRDGQAAYDYLTRTRHIDPRRIVLFGTSIGTGVTCELAQNNIVGGMALHGGFSSLRTVTNEGLPLTRFVPDFLFFRPRLDNASVLMNITWPLVIFHGCRDYIFDSRHATWMHNAAAAEEKRLVLLPNSMHVDVDSDHDLFTSELGKLVQLVTDRAN